MNIKQNNTGLIEDDEVEITVIKGNEKSFEVKEFGVDMNNKLNFNDFLNWAYKTI